ncbi:MAG: 4Fe-4S binding protein, partial [Saccharolobus sp.]
KSFKCVGIGECVNACPYDNIFFYDIRNWIRDKIHKGSIG